MKSNEPDLKLMMAKGQGYVPEGCILDGGLVMACVFEGQDPCADCNVSRHECGGRPNKNQEEEKLPQHFNDVNMQDYHDVLVAVDLSPRDSTIMVIDLVKNQALASRSFQNVVYDELFQRIMEMVSKFSATRVVFSGRAMEVGFMNQELMRFDLPFTAVKKPDRLFCGVIP